ncbi:glycosyltransferase family 4 protein [Candidatus Shapirobacteria bacterium]|nr:glycosyltransferase family 4 protein [Candidatus Shapirobacteria bacterium]
MVTIKKPKGILILTPFFAPNIGGVETHLTDLVNQLNQSKIDSYVLTYSPLTTSAKAPIFENLGRSKIIRLPWIGRNLFHHLENFPLFDFIYLTPYLFIASFIWLLKNRQKISTIHSHGFNSAFIGNTLSRIFQINHVVSTHAIYENINGLSRKITVQTLNQCQAILCLSSGSLNQLASWGVHKNRLHLFHYWLNLKQFSPSITSPKTFTILYSGRLIAKKGIKLLVKVASYFPSLKFIFVGNGPLAQYLTIAQINHKNILFLGSSNYNDQPNIYRQASILCIPSLYTEGFGRSAMEAVASGLPVIGSNIGSIGEAVDKTVSILIKPTINNIKKSIKTLYIDKSKFKKMKQSCRPYALKHYSSANFTEILKFYR